MPKLNSVSNTQCIIFLDIVRWTSDLLNASRAFLMKQCRSQGFTSQGSLASNLRTLPGHKFATSGLARVDEIS